MVERPLCWPVQGDQTWHLQHNSQWLQADFKQIIQRIDSLWYLKYKSSKHILPLPGTLVNPAALTAVIGRPPSPPTAPVIGRIPIDDGGTTLFLAPNPPLCAVASRAAVGGGRRP